jgi:nascent polypeptide-associated complex subunit alpha
MFQGMNPKLVKQAMKKMGVKEVPIDAIEVIIKTQDKELVIRNPGVTKVTMMGQETLQVTGDIEEFSRLNEEDIKTVMEQSSCSEEQAKQALEKTNGDIAEAILSLQN